MPVKRLCLILTLLVPLVVGAQSVKASGLCDLETVVATYKAALQRKKLGDLESAHRMFLPLAQAAVAPAQRHVAEYFFEESREEFALERAIMWSRLAAWGGDDVAQTLVNQAREAARHSVSEAGLKWAADWRPTQQGCYGGSSEKADDDDFKMVGRFPAIRNESVSEEQFALFVGRLFEAILIVEKVAPYFSSLLDFIPAFEVIDGDGSDRFIEWNDDTGWIHISTGYLGDETARQLSFSLILAVQRKLFSELEDAVFVDQIATHWGKTQIFGSLYGDVKTPYFLKTVLAALKRARDLPVVLRDKVNMIDEIYYMPPSRYHFSRFASEKHFAHFDHIRSDAHKKRVIFAHRLAFETPDQIVTYLVKLGSQAQQANRIDAIKAQVGGENREKAFLKALEGDPKEVFGLLGKKSDAQKKMVDEWEEKGPDGVSKLYCEAVYDQTKAAIFLEIPRTKFTNVVKFGSCAKAKKAWTDYLQAATQK